MEVAEKDELKDLLIEGRIHKTKVTIDEAKELPDLDCIKSLSAEPGQIVLSTFYITSGETKINIPQFDYVIIDEASQALLGMCVVALILGRKCLFVGDTNQLPPVLAINEDRIARRNYHLYANGLDLLNSIGTVVKRIKLYNKLIANVI